MKNLAILLLSTEKKEDLNVLMLSEAICGRLCYCWANTHYPLPSCMEEIFFPIPLIVSLASGPCHLPWNEYALGSLCAVRLNSEWEDW